MPEGVWKGIEARRGNIGTGQGGIESPIDYEDYLLGFEALNLKRRAL